MRTLSNMYEESATFQYGFLTSRTSTILSRCINTGDITLGEESVSVLKRAKAFLEDVLNGEKLISGQKEGFSPSIDGLRVFNYSLSLLSRLESLNQIQPLSDSEDIEAFFDSIHDVIVAIIKRSESDIDSNKLHLAYNFFSGLADALVEQVPSFFETEPVSLPT